MIDATSKRRARVIAQAARQRGALLRQPCERCGDAKVEAHHDDYGRPLDIRWLCPSCHRDHHRLYGASASERQVRDALRTEANMTAAASFLGVSRSTLYRLVKRHGIDIRRVIA